MIKLKRADLSSRQAGDKAQVQETGTPPRQGKTALTTDMQLRALEPINLPLTHNKCIPHIKTFHNEAQACRWRLAAVCYSFSKLTMRYNLIVYLQLPSTPRPRLPNIIARVLMYALDLESSQSWWVSPVALKDQLAGRSKSMLCEC